MESARAAATHSCGATTEAWSIQRRKPSPSIPTARCSRNPAGAELGLIFVVIDEAGNEQWVDEVLEGYAGATQNQMELQAVVQGLKRATGRHPPFEPSGYRKIVVKTDSLYVKDNFATATWSWSKNGWRTRDGRPVDNATQWKELVRLVAVAGKQGKPVTLVWVPGKKSPKTRAVDKLAKRSAKLASTRQLNPAEVRRKRTAQPTEIGERADARATPDDPYFQE